MFLKKNIKGILFIPFFYLNSLYVLASGSYNLGDISNLEKEIFLTILHVDNKKPNIENFDVVENNSVDEYINYQIGLYESDKNFKCKYPSRYHWLNKNIYNTPDNFKDCKSLNEYFKYVPNKYI